MPRPQPTRYWAQYVERRPQHRQLDRGSPWDTTKARSEIYSNTHGRYEDYDIEDLTNQTRDLFSNSSLANLRCSSRLGRPINIEILRSWIDQCDRYHENHCRPSIHSSLQGRPLRLVDVTDWCVVTAEPTARYVALSYVWGGVPPLEILKRNARQFSGYRALESDLLQRPLPRTIRDAIELVYDLGERYIWVDCLCIVQDDEEEKQHQLSQMANIYGNAVFTIAAAQGSDAGHGLHGGKVGTMKQSHSDRNKMIPRQANNTNDEVYCVEDHYAMMDNSIWISRAWTMQEVLFSRRVIFFFDNAITWECHCSVWHEWMGVKDSGGTRHQYFHHCDERFGKESRGFHQTLWPDLEDYARLVCDYNRRHLTFTNDILPAFNGVISTLTPTFQDGFLHGLPEMFFDAALLWQPLMPVKRRTSDKVDLPSWSWTGWQGLLDLGSWASAYDYLWAAGRAVHRTVHWGRTTLKTISIIKWQNVGQDGNTRREISNAANDYRAWQHDNDGIPLPTGWEDTMNPPGDKKRNEPRLQFKGDRNATFYYPIPIPVPGVPIRAKTSLPFIAGRTRRAWLKGGKTFKRLYHTCRIICLYDDFGNWAGILRLNASKSIKSDELCNKLYDDAVPCKPDSSFPRGKQNKPDIPYDFGEETEDHVEKYELVALSAGSARHFSYSTATYANMPAKIYEEDESSFLDEWDLSERPKDGEFYEFYNVLWVEWKDGIAYRKALGRVVKNVWEHVATEEIDLVLG